MGRYGEPPGAATGVAAHRLGVETPEVPAAELEESEPESVGADPSAGGASPLDGNPDLSLLKRRRMPFRLSGGDCSLMK